MRMTDMEDHTGKSEEPFIGTHVPWKLIEGEMFRVTHFTPFAIVQGNKVEAPSAPMPYALLTVESPILNQPAKIPVNHREEFLNLWDIFQRDGGVPPRGELLVSYLPYRGFLGPLLRLGTARLHMRLTGQGELERYYSDDRHWQRPSARRYFFPEGGGRRCACGMKLYTFVVRCAKCGRPVLD
ncbi:MAG: hypothetical protein A2148_01875 [Chloroflexi bacterium RBG_16_68_14]|nr:MAG: hypothetical protein A2148_01875 [Chloroflexi bacterium RBG_16_68_14]